MWEISDPKKTADPKLIDLEEKIIQMIKDELPAEKIAEEVLEYAKKWNSS